MSSPNKGKPSWLRIKVQHGTDQVEQILKKYSLNTVCREAACPNRNECFSQKTATFMILGRECTRNCGFCNVEKNPVSSPDPGEPERLAKAAAQMELKYVVVTSVTRDDLEDGGSRHYVQVIQALQKQIPDVLIEVLIPDFEGDQHALNRVVTAKPQVLNHNLETVPRLYSRVRPQADYRRSLELLRKVKEIDATGEVYTKSGIMVGLGETDKEVLTLMDDLRAVNCDFLTIGQYLAPSKRHLPVTEYVHPDTFDFYKAEAEKRGFKGVSSSPFTRSSYHAALLFPEGT